MLKNLANQVPGNSRWSAAVLFGSLGGVFAPKVGALAHVLDQMAQEQMYQNLSPGIQQALQGSLAVATGLMLPFAIAKLIHPKRDEALANPIAPNAKKKHKRLPREVILGDMLFTESDLFTNIMITGAIGSGKTSSAIYPLLDQLLKIYSIEDEDITPEAKEWIKLGGLVLDVKGDFYEALIYKMVQAGRDVLHDLVVITPHADYQYAEFVDPETGYYWYVSARGGGEDGSNEMALILSQHGLPDPTTLKPNPREVIPVNYLLDPQRMRARIGPNSELTYQQYFKNLTFDVSKRDYKFIGWRKVDEKLRRVINTVGSVVNYKEVNGKYIEVNPPKTLKFQRVRVINNGLTFNICPPSLGPAELANRLVAMSRNSSGKGGSDNAFWDDATKKHIGWVVQMWREIHPEREITAIDINRLTGNQKDIDAEVGRLSEAIDEKQDGLKLMSGSERARVEGELQILRDMLSYFDGEWKTLDPKTKSNLVSCITNLFGQFMSDPKLRQVFCVPSSFKIEEIMQSGKIFTLVAPEYESAARIFGTALKMEFQAIMRRRPAQAHFNKERFILFMCDEAQNYVTAGGADNTGDENFMALSRQSRVCNIIATQSDSSIINVIGEKSSPVYYQSFGGRMWYQNTDSRTNESASKICGKIKKEKRSKSGRDVSVYTMLSKDEKGYSENISVDNSERFPPEVFPNLNIHECVIYNKGRKGAKEKATRYQMIPDPIGSKEEKLKKNEIIRWYFQAYIENQLLTMGEQDLIEHDKTAKTATTGNSGTAAAAPKRGQDIAHTPLKREVSENLPMDDGDEDAAPKSRFQAPQKQRGPVPPFQPLRKRVPQNEDLDEDEDPIDRDLLDEDDDASRGGFLPRSRARLDKSKHFKDPFGNATDDTPDEDADEPVFKPAAQPTRAMPKNQPVEEDDDDIPDELRGSESKAETQESSLSDEDIARIRATFGDANTIGSKLGYFVSVIDKATAVETDFEPHMQETTYKNFDGEQMAKPEGRFKPSDNFEVERSRIEDPKPLEPVNTVTNATPLGSESASANAGAKDEQEIQQLLSAVRRPVRKKPAKG